ncbi:hypothetical protein [Streptomyces sp. NPDC029674]|uniref:hypothetical protein n=1 Tax=Streptomyces sp. NPDC029674 TaxID=3365297 RepID=UPI00384F1C06
MGGQVPARGIFLGPEASLWQRLRFGPGEGDPWEGADFVSFLDAEEPSGAGEFGMYVSWSTDPTLQGVGEWSTMTGPDLSPPAWPSVAAYLEAVCELLQTGDGTLLEMADRQQPVLSLGCLVWIDPEDGLEVPWRPVRPWDELVRAPLGPHQQSGDGGYLVIVHRNGFPVPSVASSRALGSPFSAAHPVGHIRARFFLFCAASPMQ